MNRWFTPLLKIKHPKTLFINKRFSRAGFTLVETLIAIAIFAIITVGIYFSYTNILDIYSASYLNLTALSALDNEFEVIRNMPYSDVGTIGGVPSGVIPTQKDIVYGNVPFVVNTYVRNVDDPFDGTLGGTPNDTTPADYKLVEIEINCPTCARFIVAKATTTVAPVGLETATNNGSLVIKVINASGQPVAGANVVISNTSISPAINISDTTDSTGTFKLIDAPPSSAGYAITVSKSGYSTDKNYKPGDPSNPNPLKPYATVVTQQVTQTSFIIDRVSTLSIKTQNKFCSGVGNIGLLMTGQKLIGTNPNTPKYSATQTTDVSGNKTVSNLEFDAYSFANQSSNYEITGFSPLTPIAVDPNGTYAFTLVMESKTPSAILVTVKDQNGQLINDAKVTLTKSSFSSSEYTGRKHFTQTDWSGGQYTSKTSAVETDNPTGQLTISQVGGKYSTASQELISSTVDFGTSNTTFYNLSWNPTTQPSQTGANSLKIQIATNNDNSSWNFVGPDGTANTYYTTSSTQISSNNNGNRYLRYKVILSTLDSGYTPQLSDITFDFHSSCVLDGQAYFSGLSQGTYKIKIEKTGYQIYNDSGYNINANWKDYRATLQ